jgi:TonB family protein
MRSADRNKARLAARRDGRITNIQSPAVEPDSSALHPAIDFASISRETPLRACIPQQDRRLQEQNMFPQPMSRPELRSDDSLLDPIHALEQHVLAGFPPELALDLLLNELVARAAESVRAGAAALALVRGDEMVCRAATGHLAPDLGVAINTRDGLSAACLQTRQPQLSVDTEFDPRIDPVISRRVGIRSILIVPVFDVNEIVFNGILEVFSGSPAAFSHNDQNLLEGFAKECARICQAAIELSLRKQDEVPAPELVAPGDILAGFDSTASRPRRRSSYELWTLIVGSLAILAIIGVSFLMGSRIGWWQPSADHAQNVTPISRPLPIEAEMSQPPAESVPAKPTLPRRAKSSLPEKARASESSSTNDDLVVYEKGKVIFRLKPTPAGTDEAKSRPTKSVADSAASISSAPAKQDGNSIVEAASTTKIAPLQSVWLAPEEAQARLVGGVEPEYPQAALETHRSGKVVLEVLVAEDGSVSSARVVSGDPILAAAATQAVRNWRYQPYRVHDRPTQFQTDITLTFSGPN